MDPLLTQKYQEAAQKIELLEKELEALAADYMAQAGEKLDEIYDQLGLLHQWLEADHAAKEES